MRTNAEWYNWSPRATIGHGMIPDEPYKLCSYPGTIPPNRLMPSDMKIQHFSFFTKWGNVTPAVEDVARMYWMHHYLHVLEKFRNMVDTVHTDFMYNVNPQDV